MTLELSAALLYALVQYSPVVPTFSVQVECSIQCDHAVWGQPVTLCRWTNPVENLQEERMELYQAAVNYGKEHCLK